MCLHHVSLHSGTLFPNQCRYSLGDNALRALAMDTKNLPFRRKTSTYLLIPPHLHCGRNRPIRALISRHIHPHRRPSRLRIPLTAHLSIPRRPSRKRLDHASRSRCPPKILQPDNRLERSPQAHTSHIPPGANMRAPAKMNIAVQGPVKLDLFRVRERNRIVVGRRQVHEDARACFEFVRGRFRVRVGLRVETVGVGVWVRYRGGEIGHDLVGGKVPVGSYGASETRSLEEAVRALLVWRCWKACANRWHRKQRYERKGPTISSTTHQLPWFQHAQGHTFSPNARFHPQGNSPPLGLAIASS